MGATFLYIIQAGEFCKVGFSKHPKQRLVEVATGCPYKPELKFYKKVDNVEIMEKRCHAALKRFHARLEWFKLEYSMCAQIVSKVLSEWKYEAPEPISTHSFKVDPEKFSFEQAQAFINRESHIFDDVDFLDKVVPEHVRTKGWKFRIDSTLRTFFGDLN